MLLVNVDSVRVGRFAFDDQPSAFIGYATATLSLGLLWIDKWCLRIAWCDACGHLHRRCPCLFGLAPVGVQRRLDLASMKITPIVRRGETRQAGQFSSRLSGTIARAAQGTSLGPSDGATRHDGTAQCWLQDFFATAYCKVTVSPPRWGDLRAGAVTTLTALCDCA